MQLKDAQLFRQQAYIDGQWLDADSGGLCAAVGMCVGMPPEKMVVHAVVVVHRRDQQTCTHGTASPRQEIVPVS